MAKLLGIISLILAIVLFPPAALAVISNNAAPGDATYPIKRGLEDVIYAVASLTPTTKAWFAAARSDRRFQEVAALITQGKQAGDTLNELVEQTQIAASQIAQVSDLAQRTKLIEQLSGSIEKYDKGLEKLAPENTASPQATSSLQTTTSPVSTTLPKPTVSPATVRPTPRPTVQPTPTSLPTVEPTSKPNRQEEEKEKQRQREIEEARRRLEEIRRRLEEESSRHQVNQTQSRDERNRDNEQNSDNKKGDKSDKKEEKSENRIDNKRKD